MSPEFTELICDACGLPFQRRASALRKEIKRGRKKFYCSNPCRYAGSRTQIELTCDLCGSAFLRYRSEIAKSAVRNCARIICSKECERRWNAANAVTLTCPHCDKPFTVWPSRVAHNTANGQQVYCSAKCRDQANGERQRNKVEVACFVCGKSHMRIPANVRKHNFCSPGCRSIGIASWTGKRKTGIDMPCETCGKMVYRKPHQFKHRTFCSRQCANARTHKIFTKGWAISNVRPDLGHLCRSTWEANFCRVLRAMGVAYQYEPVTFRLNGTWYTPDIQISDTCWIEVKGWMKPGVVDRIALFRATHPDKALIVLDAPMYAAIEREWSSRIPEWEFPPKRNRKAA